MNKYIFLILASLICLPLVWKIAELTYNSLCKMTRRDSYSVSDSNFQFGNKDFYFETKGHVIPEGQKLAPGWDELLNKEVDSDH